MVLWKTMDIAEAQEKIAMLEISAYPHMKKEAAEKLYHQVYKRAYPDKFNKVIEADDLVGMLNGY